jgi:glycosyltransferase involved in cell wall biosynthesis
MQAKRKHNMKKVIVWETSPSVAGGQKMTLTVMDLLKDDYLFHCLIPGEGTLADELKKRGIPYTLMGDQSMPAGVKGKRVYFQYAWLSLKNIVSSLGAIRRFQPDLLYAPGPASLPWSAVCGALTGKPVIWHLHHLFMDGATKKLLDFTGKWKSVKHIVSVSEVVGDQITNPKGHKKVQCIYNPVDAEKYASGNGQMVLAEAEAKLGRSVRQEGTLVLLETAVLRKSKCQDLFIRVVDALKKKGISVVGLIVGEAITEDDQAFKEELIRQIADSNLTGDIYMAGYRNNVQDYLAAADFVFVPSVVEGLSLAAQEAMSAQRDIIATAVGGVAELMRVADCGSVYPQDASAEQIADIILNASRTDRRQKIQNGYEFCRAHSREAYQKSIRDVFSAVLEG